MNKRVRKYIAILLMAALAISVLPVGVFGTVVNADALIPITNGLELSAICGNMKGQFYLAADIDMAGADRELTGNRSAPFYGALGGNGHTSHNLCIAVNTSPLITSTGRANEAGYLVLMGSPNPFESGGTGPGDGPSIVVLTEFPAGAVRRAYLDINYTAEPSFGAVITEVFYTINDGPPHFIYLSGADGVTPRGELGRARVFITPQPENHFVFYVIDSAGRKAYYEIANRPTLEWSIGEVPPNDPNKMEFRDDGTVLYLNRLSVSTNRPHPAPYVVAEAVAAIGGVIIEGAPIVGQYTIEVPLSDEEGLRRMADELMSEFPDLFRWASLSTGWVVATMPPDTEVTGPSIVVLTEFPTGEVDVSWIDIEYIAIPTPGAAITEVFYTINNGPPSYIYISEASNHTARGELGTARVFVLPHPENRFVFTVRDTAGGEASFEVADRPSFSAMGGHILSPIPDFDMWAFEYVPPPQWVIDYYAGHGIVHDRQPSRVRFIKNRLLLRTVWSEVPPHTHVTPACVAAAVATIDGIIVGQAPMTGRYTIEIPPMNSIAELEQLGEDLIAAFPELFAYVFLSIAYAGEGSPNNTVIRHTNQWGLTVFLFLLLGVCLVIPAIIIIMKRRNNPERSRETGQKDC